MSDSPADAGAPAVLDVRIDSLRCTPVLVPMRYTLGTSAATAKGSVPDVRAPRELAVRRVDAGNFSCTACRGGRMMEEATVLTDRSSRRSKEPTR